MVSFFPISISLLLLLSPARVVAGLSAISKGACSNVYVCLVLRCGLITTVFTTVPREPRIEALNLDLDLD